MTETSPAEPLTTPSRRRRPIVIAGGVLLVVVVALVAWISTRQPSPDAERDTALQGVLAYGGPPGWQRSEDPAIDTTDDIRWAEQDGGPVLLHDNGFTVVWSTPATAESCKAVADWAAKRLAPEAGSDVTVSCPAALAGKSGDERVFSSYGTEPGEHGRYVFVARMGADTIFATLAYQGPDPKVAR